MARRIFLITPWLLAAFFAFVRHAPEPPVPDTGEISPSTPPAPSATNSRPDPREPARVGPGSPVEPITESLSGRNEPESTLRKELSEREQRSLSQALSEARRAVRAIPDSRAGREENRGYDFYALHPRQNLATRFGTEAVQLVSSERRYNETDREHPATSWEARLRLRSFAGREVATGAVPEPSPQSRSRVEYRRGPHLTEWYDNGPEAMEHGFTVAARPGHLAEGGEVVLEMGLEGLEADGREGGDLVLRDRGDGREVLGYEKLVVFDADGRELPARMAPTEDGFLLAYHDAGARYPVTVDPLIVNQEAKLNRLDAEPGDRFGESVAISGNTIVVGVPFDDDGGSDSGSAYVFVSQSVFGGSIVSFQAKLTASDATADDQFGEAVSISGDRVVIGSLLDDDAGGSSGSAYVFARSADSWSEEAKLTASDAAASSLFGGSVSISDDTVVVGATGDGSNGFFSGSAYVFARSAGSWSEEAKLTASDAASFDFFGGSVSVSGDTVVVGADGTDDAGTRSGSAYVFTRAGTSWTQEAELAADDAEAEDRFGRSVSISGDSVVVGAPLEDFTATDTGSAYVFTRTGSSWDQQAKLNRSDSLLTGEFGGAVSISGDTVVVGHRLDDEGGGDSGSAYVYQRSGTSWSEVEKLTASNAAVGDEFGTAVAVSGDRVVVGAPLTDREGADAGSMYVFDDSAGDWFPLGQFVASDAAPGDNFGDSVSISGDTLVVGTPFDSDAGSNSGSAYVFQRDNQDQWAEQAKLTASDAVSGDWFGRSVSISGERLVVGAPEDGGLFSGSGKAYVFVRSNGLWTEEANLSAPDAADEDEFGNSVAISGDTVVVGIPQDDDRGFNSGSALVFLRSVGGWGEEAKLTASDGAISDLFGGSVSISGDTVVIGADQDDDDGDNAGSVYVFVRTGSAWSEQAKLYASDAAASDFFGDSVSISGDTLVAGSPFDDDNGDSSGSAYVFTRSGNSWSEQTKLTASDAGPGDLFGSAVSISGNTVVAGSYVFTRDAGAWSEDVVLDRFGGSVSISGDTVVVGAADDDDGGSNTGSAYVYRLAVPSARNLIVTDHLGTAVGDGGRAAAFDGLRTGTTRPYLFTLANSGELDLDLQTITLGGTDAGEFALTVPDISSPADLAQSESLAITITFQPTGASGTRQALLIVSSNDTDTPVHSVEISGLGLSESADADGDGMNDWAEYGLRGFGFDWETSQEGLVTDYYAMAPRAGLVTLDEVTDLRAGSFLLDVDPATNRAEFAIELQQSPDLDSGFSPIFADLSRVSIDAQGRLVYEVDAPDGKHFYRMEVGP